MEILGHKLYVDTNVFIYSIEGEASKKKAIEDFFILVSNKVKFVITSELTVAECLVKPKRDSDINLENLYLDILVESENIFLKIVDINIWILAADIRAKYNFQLSDSVHIATAILNDCSFVTNDKGLKNVEGLEILYLDDFLQ